MLEQIDLSRKISKTEYKSMMETIEPKLGILQREAMALKIPVIVVFEGWDAAGKGTLINRLILNLDPRHFTVNSIKDILNEEEFYRPFLWPFWIKTPARGRMRIFDRSWYRRVLTHRVNKTVSQKDWVKAYQEINFFERQLAVDGAVIIKFFLHISKKEQKKRFRKLEKNSATAWRVTKTDWQHHKKYNEYAVAVEEMLAKTDTSFAPWTIVESENWRFAAIKIFETVIRNLEEKIAEIKAHQSKKIQKSKNFPANSIDINTNILEKIDLSANLTREQYSKALNQYQARIRKLQHEVYQQRIPVIITYEGWDAGGKGGNIKRLTQKLDPRGYEVIPIAAPNDIEKKHHYLWRFWKEIPKAGHFAIFDRTWYGRVLVERIEGFAAEHEWKRAYREINEMEEQLSSFGTVLVKFWIHISQEEQLRRFEERQNIPSKRWKITEEDWRNREKWNLYLEAVNEMLYRTSSPHAPWTVIEGNSKHYARIKALKTVIEAIEQKL